jgi:methyl-accepting chemotaxis protein I, serine sensor receptor
VNALSTMVADVMSATQGQTSGIERVNGAIGVIDETTRENAALVEQAASASRAMRESAEILRREVAYFTLEAA